jgi:sulfatase maturation enzyme AslB (radical SAM superfamily)
MLYTVLDYPTELEPGMPGLATRISEFRRIADRYGPDRVAWRYDPILVSQNTDPAFHRSRFRAIASNLRGATTRVIISFFDAYPKARSRLASIGAGAYRSAGDPAGQAVADLVPALVDAAREHNMDIRSCAEKLDLQRFGVPPGACIDGHLLEDTTGRPMPKGKDAGQRKLCRCVPSRDIGAYDTCRFRCVYCYATNRPAGTTSHDPSASMLVG